MRGDTRRPDLLGVSHILFTLTARDGSISSTLLLPAYVKIGQFTKEASEVSGMAHQLPGLRVEYNHDLNVSQGFLLSYAQIQDALQDERLMDAFKYYDSQAKSHKWMFHSLGFLSLILGLLTLASAALAVIAGESIVHRVGAAGAIVDSGSVGALLLILWNRLRRHRVLWCQAVFCRERLRQWHFQLFLDGRLIGLLPNQPDRFKAEVDRRWGVLEQNLRDGYGMMTAFVRHGSRTEDFFHEPSKYEDASLAKAVLEALWTLRFEHQLRYGQRKVEPEAEKAGMALEERTNLSESVATFTLVGAVLVGALGFFVALSQGFPALNLFSWNVEFAETVSRRFAGSALLLAVLSAASRAYRAGYTLPDESESYEEYCDRVREYKAVFESAATEQERLRELGNLEAEAALELRRFLRMKMRATFIF